MRGEYCVSSMTPRFTIELPPRARRILRESSAHQLGGGTTSACAENTYVSIVLARHSGNYLRVRGEYNRKKQRCSQNLELPPRARRILGWVPCAGPIGGTTSACAENTSSSPSLPTRGRNYLRVRGEYSSGRPIRPCLSELPPRARRIPWKCHIVGG